MRCYRCGALMNDHNAVCPECGFNINSPVEIETNKWMKGVQIFDAEGALLWEGTDGGTAFIEAPTRRRINLDMIISVGYRVKSKRGVEFRRWANNALKADRRSYACGIYDFDCRIPT